MSDWDDDGFYDALAFAAEEDRRRDEEHELAVAHYLEDRERDEEDQLFWLSTAARTEET